MYVRFRNFECFGKYCCAHGKSDGFGVGNERDGVPFVQLGEFGDDSAGEILCRDCGECDEWLRDVGRKQLGIVLYVRGECGGERDDGRDTEQRDDDSWG